MFSLEEISEANRTCRDKGAVGPNAMIPRLVPEYANLTDHILDFGAGRKALHAENLMGLGYNVTAWDFGANFNPEVHDRDALSRTYDVVYASNVFNVQINPGMFWRTLIQIRDCVKPDGLFLFNYPRKPRKLNYTDREVLQAVGQIFDSVHLARDTAFIAEGPK